MSGQRSWLDGMGGDLSDARRNVADALELLLEEMRVKHYTPTEDDLRYLQVEVRRAGRQIGALTARAEAKERLFHEMHMRAEVAEAQVARVRALADDTKHFCGVDLQHVLGGPSDDAGLPVSAAEVEVAPEGQSGAAGRSEGDVSVQDRSPLRGCLGKNFTGGVPAVEYVRRQRHGHHGEPCGSDCEYAENE